MLARPAVWGNLLFLGIVASMLCYVLWNAALHRLGAVRTTNYTVSYTHLVSIIQLYLCNDPQHRTASGTARSSPATPGKPPDTGSDIRRQGTRGTLSLIHISTAGITKVERLEYTTHPF